tara:strand:- start:11089 stop:11820 length:732 start_codon:yes stop_codon:yes gene_type:complete
VIKYLIKKIFNSIGLDIHRYNPTSGSTFEVYQSIKMVRTNVILDIGANIGQFASQIRKKGYKGKIVSFEPLSSAREILLSNSLKDQNWFIHDRSAIGDNNGNIEINISKNSVSSSILPLLRSHTDAEETSKYIGSEKTPIVTLDSVKHLYLNKFSNCFIKIDTQGYEWQVIDGAINTINESKGILCELSLVPLYEGQHLWRDIIERFESMGFILWSFQKAFSNKQDGRTLQVDAVFLKKNSID